MNINAEENSRIYGLSQEILILSRNTLLVNLRFLDAAISRLNLQVIPTSSLITDGKILGYNPTYILKSYLEEKETPIRDYLHVVFHCIFHHLFIDSLIDLNCWDLACDIAVENAINELDLPSTKNLRAINQAVYINELKKSQKVLTAEKLYRFYLDSQKSEEELNEIRQLFFADDHLPWHLPPKSSEDQISSNNPKSSGSKKYLSSAISRPTKTTAADWSTVSYRTQVDIDTFSKLRGDANGGWIQNLKEVNREKYDYSRFLKKFSVLGEAMTINDDEFDYIFYTYGLKLYDKMPLIEPLEYKEVKRIKEFIIAIDTSGSVYGDLVQAFIQKTFNILKSTESFFTKINLHIIQCDAQIQESVKITSEEEFDVYIKTMEIKGFGGTDFRPVFNYVDGLIAKKEFTNLKGLIYFTDGYGIFPKQTPHYDTAFIFIDDQYAIPAVPAWAIKLVLEKEDIKNENSSC